jgi:hypothetical protein
MAGVLLVYMQHQVVADSFGVPASITVFLATVVGGLTSVGFAVAGAISLEFFVVFGPRYYAFLGPNIIAIVPLILTGPLLVLNLYQYPGGSAEAGFQNRDRFLRWVARRHDILVPSLVADKRVEEQEQEAEIVEIAERSVEAAESFDSAEEPTITCPVCGVVLTLSAAVDHEHLREPVKTRSRSRAK